MSQTIIDPHESRPNPPAPSLRTSESAAPCIRPVGSVGVALAQAALFKEALELTGLILTKLDGTAKGGIVLGVCDELKVPVRYIGLGERAEDLREFVPVDFVEALFGRDDDEAAAA